jgi:AcrR family transcriptional regulator
MLLLLCSNCYRYNVAYATLLSRSNIMKGQEINKTEAKRQAIIEKLADHLLAHGLQKASLRPLAAAAGTSDRMLLHYFKNKEELLAAVLVRVSDRLVVLLEGAKGEQMPFQDLLPYMALMIRDPRVRPYLSLWLELIAFAAGGEESYRTIARNICDSFLEWIAAALLVEREAERMPLASLAFATIEGLVLLDALEYGKRITSALEGIALR